jgi:hypothetical protein
MKTPNQPAESSSHAKPSNFWVLTLGSIGVVYGDIGTSPLYALREAVTAATSVDGEVTRDAVLGVLSLIFWSLIVVVTLKYILILLRADNNGEGGTLSLTALVFKALGRRSLILVLGIIGASMFYGSVLITPALSVLSAVEGLNVATPAFEPYVMPLAVVILVTLFSVQWRGTAKGFSILRTHHHGLVRHSRDRRHFANPHQSRRPRRAQSLLRIRVPAREPRHRPRDAGCRLPRRDRLRGALQRSRPFRQEADADRVDLSRAAGAGAELFRSGRARAQRPVGAAQPLLPHVS